MPPRDASLPRIGATIIDGVLFVIILATSPLFLGIGWWCCRLYFHVKSGTSVGKKVFHLRLVDLSTFQHPEIAKCLLHDILGMIGYASLIDAILIRVLPTWLSNAIAILSLIVAFGSLLTLALDKKFGRTIYDYWSSTAVVRESDSDRFYPTITGY